MFDGMDFQGDECRLVVLATLPRAINIQEEFLCAYLRDAGFMKKGTVLFKKCLQRTANRVFEVNTQRQMPFSSTRNRYVKITSLK